ncbi:hypothetical protein BDV93DRAFT_604730 [Ceratobasidium sp. AG-I]|nr:hypothetical protein BDV93DRAFT_604730 [Ceratobasidium sp. AG-I]
MSSTPSHIAVNWSLGALKENKNLAAIRFPLGWDSKIGPVFSWYGQLACTKFVSIQYRKQREFPFYHEFLCAKLTNGELCRFERFGDPDARADAITEEGSVAHDSAEILSPNQLAVLDKTSDILEEFAFLHEQDIMDVLEICYNIQQDRQTRAYTLQRYNCYFFCWCTLLLLTRKASHWEIVISETTWDQTIRQLESDLSKAAPADEDSLVFLLCRWLEPNTSRPERYVVRTICDELSKIGTSTLKTLCQQLKFTLWECDWQRVVREEICNIRMVAEWPERQTPICNIANMIEKTGVRWKIDHQSTGSEHEREHRLKLRWMKKIVGRFKDRSGPRDEETVQVQLKALLTGGGRGSARDVINIIEAEGCQTKWDKLWRQFVEDLLHKYLAPLVIQSVLSRGHLLRVSYPLDSNGGAKKEEIGTSQLQQIIQARIASHAFQVEQMRLGSDSQIQLDVKETINGILCLMATR